MVVIGFVDWPFVCLVYRLHLQIHKICTDKNELLSIVRQLVFYSDMNAQNLK